MTRIEGQLRITPSGRVMGWDMSAALAMARALGLSVRAAAELLPAVEPVMAREINRQIGERE